MFQDLRYALRQLRKSPVFAVVAVLAIALGIGANTAIFSVVNAVLLRPLPYQDPDRLVMVWENNYQKGRDINTIAPANFLDWRDQSTVFEQMAAFYDARFNLTGVDDPEEVPGQVVTVNFFSLLGASASVGRTFTPNEGERGQNDVVILGNGFWRRRFGADPDVIGKTILLDGHTITVVGVMPPGFRPFIKANSLSNKQPDMWLPLAFTPNARIRRGRYMSSMARL